MISRKDVERITDSFYEVERILREVSDYYLTKEEIYARVPRDYEGVPFMTIASLETALRGLLRARVIDVTYVRGVRHFAYIPDRERG